MKQVDKPFSKSLSQLRQDPLIAGKRAKKEYKQQRHSHNESNRLLIHFCTLFVRALVASPKRLEQLLKDDFWKERKNRLKADRPALVATHYVMGVRQGSGRLYDHAAPYVEVVEHFFEENTPPNEILPKLGKSVSGFRQTLRPKLDGGDPASSTPTAGETGGDLKEGKSPGTDSGGGGDGAQQQDPPAGPNKTRPTPGAANPKPRQERLSPTAKLVLDQQRQVAVNVNSGQFERFFDKPETEALWVMIKDGPRDPAKPEFRVFEVAEFSVLRPRIAQD